MRTGRLLGTYRAHHHDKAVGTACQLFRGDDARGAGSVVDDDGLAEAPDIEGAMSLARMSVELPGGCATRGGWLLGYDWAFAGADRAIEPASAGSPAVGWR